MTAQEPQGATNNPLLVPQGGSDAQKRLEAVYVARQPSSGSLLALTIYHDGTCTERLVVNGRTEYTRYLDAVPVEWPWK